MAVALGVDPIHYYLDLNQAVSQEFLKGKNLLEKVTA